MILLEMKKHAVCHSNLFLFMKKNILKISIYVLVFLCFSVFVIPVQASVFDEMINNLGTFNQTAQLPANNDLIGTIIGIINIILGFLALLFIIMILYGGFTYLTAAGNADNAKKAIGIIKDAVIGVVIVVLSGVFVNYILIKIIEVVQ